MGCAGSKPTESASASASKDTGSASSDEPAAAVPKKTNEAIENLFRTCGAEKDFKNGEVLIEQDSLKDSAFYLLTGQVKLYLNDQNGNDTHLATRTTGDVLGELSLLLGNPASVTAIAEGDVSVYEVRQDSLMTKLSEDPKTAGRLFKAMAVALAERISELSSKLRSNVVAGSNAAAPTQSQTLPAADIAKARSMFELDKNEKLISFYQGSVRAEKNAIKDEHAHVGEMYVFEKHVCFDLKVFAFHKQLVVQSSDIQALIKPDGKDHTKTIEIQLSGASYEVTIENGYEEACLLIEASRMSAKAAKIAAENNESSIAEGQGMDQFNEMLEPLVLDQTTEKHNHTHRAVDFDLSMDDWRKFLQGARQRTYKKGEYVLKEGQPTAALFQIVSGTLRVELQIKDKAQAVIVGYRQAGDMFGETSLLKSGVATASIAAESEAVVMCLEGSYLEELFQESPGLPGRFFCFIAAYEAERLYQLTKGAADSKKPKVTVSNSVRVSLDEIMANRAYSGVLRKYLTSVDPKSSTFQNDNPSIAIGSFDLAVMASEFEKLPHMAALMKEAVSLSEKHLNNPSSPYYLPYLPEQLRDDVKANIMALEKNELQIKDARMMFAEANKLALGFISTYWLEPFLGSDHYGYILELKAKEGQVPAVGEFQIIRVLGEGGFGQVLEVVKRDCGVRYAMKVMQKEAMKQALGTATWRKKIAMEANILSSLQHPFMVNLKYAFQNSDFLCLVMDLVPSGDLSEFVLTPRRLTAAQTKWAIMEVVEVFSYMHDQKILYRDLKPENLLIDDVGHVRLIDMGLAVRWNGERPKRMSRVGTDCYMAPEVRWCRKTREAYGTTIDWYTVGVLMYEFTHGALPFSQRDLPKPVYREPKAAAWPSPACKDLCEGLLVQDWHNRTACKGRGVLEIKEHAFFSDVDWDIVKACKLPSPLKGVKGVPKRKKDKETQAQRTAHSLHEGDIKEQMHQETVSTWDYVSPVAITEEYLESMYRCVSSI